MMALERELRAAFKGILTDEAIISECPHLCRVHNLTAEQLVERWTLYTVNNASSGPPSLDAFQRQLTSASKHRSPAKRPAEDALDDRHAVTSEDVMDASFLSMFGTDEATIKAIEQSKADVKQERGPGGLRADFTTPPSAMRRRNVAALGGMAGVLEVPKMSTEAGSPSAATYASRPNRGEVEMTYNPENLADEFSATLEHTDIADIPVFANSLSKSYHFMFEKLLDRAEVLDLRLEELGDKIVSKHKLLASKPPVKKDGAADAPEKEDEEEEPPRLAHVGHPTQEQVVVTGRICLDSFQDGKLNGASVIFEGSKETSAGCRVPLNLRGVGIYSLFPGQIVAAEGTNNDGAVFNPTCIYQGAPRPLPSSKPEALLGHYHLGDKGDRQATDILVAAGPFTLQDDLSYAPLTDLLAQVANEAPDVLVLLGPFVDEKHMSVAEGNLEVPFDDVFSSVLQQIYAAMKTAPKMRVVLVPNSRDVFHDNVFPQPPFTLPQFTKEEEKSIRERLLCLANPSTFTIKEFAVGVISEDILFHIASQETSRGHSGDRLGRLVNHLFDQRCYYPLFPSSPDVNFDLGHLEATNFPVTPDILIIPSRLKSFAKNVNGSLVINPGYLTKGQRGGTFARVLVHAPRRSAIPEVTNGKKVTHNVPGRSVAKIVRI